MGSATRQTTLTSDPYFGDCLRLGSFLHWGITHPLKSRLLLETEGKVRRLFETLGQQSLYRREYMVVVGARLREAGVDARRGPSETG
jgi:hypothetical protein